MPLGKTYKDQSCPIARSLELIGERWTLLIVRDALGGLSRFDRDGPRGGYRLTRKGLDLVPVILAVLQWGRTHGPDGDTAGRHAASIVHTRCEHEVHTRPHCTQCGDPVTLADLRITSDDGPAPRP
ncbi:winged helix-turn-helix transcriptional regulator [Pseudonocardia sp. H11422]|uniref:winged helix-turn-helix transcriptional regulator n=1 Tax=Pseudonocardia sp. H11422 TaxID=2835866 RepID=UPI001BDC7B64|nr:helix-turn-helix domain-containing protein [Pseudonocardia sp. H11422]